MPELKKEDLEKSEEELKEAAEKLEAEQAKETEATEKLEEKTAERLETIFEKEESLDKEPESDSEKKPSTPESDDSAKDDDDDEDDSTATKKDEPDEKDKVGDETKDEEDDKAKDEEADKGKDEKKVPPLSDAYYRAAIHRGWKPEDIEAQYKANPELTIRTLGNVYEALKRSSQEYAAFGRAQKERVAAVETSAAAAETTTQKESEFKGVDIEALRKTDVDPDVIAVVEAMNQQNKLQFDELQGLKAARSAPATVQPSGLDAAQTRALNQEVAMIQQQIEAFFNSDVLKGYEDFYGVLAKDAIDWGSLTPGQKQNRLVAIEMMDEMITGAKHLGREMKIDEALERAHLSVTECIREKVIREDIIAKVKKRGNNLSLKPSGTAQPTGGKPQTPQELETVTAERLKKVYS